MLLVDDNATDRLIVQLDVTNWGMHPVLAESGREAIELLRAAAAAGEPFDVALLDVHMPEFSGLDLAEAVTADPALPVLPVVLLSSAAAVDADRRERAGIHGVLMKPLRQCELHDALVQAMTQAAPQATRPVAPQPEPPWAVHDEPIGSILVVEDNAINQTVAAGTLAKLGYHYDLAANGLEALDALARRQYSAVLMDCQMPEMDGFHATEEIRRREGDGRRTPIIAMTASAMEGDRERCLASGMDDYWPSPCGSRRWPPCFGDG